MNATRVTIIGAGIGGLTAALHLHQVGCKVTIYEKTPVVQELGVGINLLPHAVAELAELGPGLLGAIHTAGVETSSLKYLHHRGQTVLSRACGRDAGAAYPQISIHRGRLQQLLLRAVRDRIGNPSIHPGHRLISFDQGPKWVRANLEGPAGAVNEECDVLVAADGIHSAVRRQFEPEEGAPRFSGITLYRGATDWPPYADGATMLVAGDTSELGLVVYPIARGSAHGTMLTNWALCVRTAADGAPAPMAQDWSRLADLTQVRQHLDWFDLRTGWGLSHHALVANTRHIYEFPMCDRDPLGYAVQGRVALLGDAFHPFRPMGSQGAAQAILDASCLAWALTQARDPRDALLLYQQKRVPRTSELMMANRLGGPERVIRKAQERHPEGFTDLDPGFVAELHRDVDNYLRSSLAN